MQSVFLCPAALRKIMFLRFYKPSFNGTRFFVQFYKICAKYLDKGKKVLYDLEKLNFKCIDGKSSFAITFQRA